MPLRDAQLAIRAIEALHNLTEGMKSGHQSFFLALVFHLQIQTRTCFQSPCFSITRRRTTTYPLIRSLPMTYLMSHGVETTSCFIYMQTLASLMLLRPSMRHYIPDQRALDLRRAYHCAITWIDIQLGRILNTLDELGLANNTIISFFGDHGYQLGEHAQRGKSNNFDIATHGPMMIHVPELTDDEYRLGN